MEFKGIIEHLSFSKLSNQEKYELLIAKKIYIILDLKSNDEIEIIEVKLESDENELLQFPRYMTFKNRFYKLNESLIEELKTSLHPKTIEIFENWNERSKSLKIQFEYLPENDAKDIRDSIKVEYSKILSENIVRELETKEHSDFVSHNSIMLKYALLDHFFIYDFLIGKKNECRNCHSNYSSYLKCKIHVDILDELLMDENFKELKTSIPKRIALMSELGMLSNKTFLNMTMDNKIKVVSYLLSIDLTKNRKTYIRKQITSLNIESEMDPKGMASLHLDKILKEVLNS